MIFDEKTHKVKWWLINKREAVAYIDFLEEERYRHDNATEYCDWCIAIHGNKRGTYDKATVELWQSAVLRHQEDTEGIDTLIQEVKHWHQI